MSAGDAFRQQAARLRASSATLPARAEQIVSKVATDTKADAQAFAPVDTGNLRNSITTGRAPEHNGSNIAHEVVARTNYALYVEGGTSRMEPRPFMGPATERNAPALREAMGALGKDLA